MCIYIYNLTVNDKEGLIFFKNCGGARGVMVIVVGNRHSDMSSNPGRG